MLARFISLLALPLLVASFAAASETARPNIVLMMADDLGWGDTGYNGHPVLKTPNLDAMAAAGLRCTRFYAAAPVCSPTRGSCLTGRHPFRYGVTYANAGHLRAGEVTLAELLRGRGYATGHFGKWHLGTLTTTVLEANRGGPRGAKHFSPPWRNGFARCFSTESKVPTWDPMLKPRGARRTWWEPLSDSAETLPYGTHYWADGRVVEDDLRGDDSRLIMDRALPFIRDAVKRERPFFAVIWFHAPHLPVVAGPKYTRLYPNASDYARHYYGCVTALDEQVGRLRAELRALGVAENTLLTFCSDNGPEGRAGKAPGSTGGLRGRKRDLFEGGVRVPGLIEWPAKIPPGSTTDVPATTSDYLPTILEVLGATLPDDRPIDGVSLAPLFAGEMRERPEPIAFESRKMVALVGNRYKLIGSVAALEGKRPAKPKQAALMLFDLAADPGERRDLAGEHPEVVRRMAEQLRAWRASCARSRAGEDYK